MAIDYPAGMTEQARFTEGAVGFELWTIRGARRTLAMTDQELRDRQLRLPVLLRNAPEVEREQAKWRLRLGFKMTRVRTYATELASEHR